MECFVPRTIKEVLFWMTTPAVISFQCYCLDEYVLSKEIDRASHTELVTKKLTLFTIFRASSDYIMLRHSVFQE